MLFKEYRAGSGILRLPRTGGSPADRALDRYFLSGGDFVPQGYLAASRDALGCHNWEGVPLLAVGRRGRGCSLLGVLLCTGQPPTAKNSPAQGVNSACSVIIKSAPGVRTSR